MAVKLLLADKSITIQKVVEMLFSGKEYEVLCVSDGESALSEASRTHPDVVLADVDLPRLDGYAFATRLRQLPGFAQTPVVMMLSRDDVFDAAKGRAAGILDHIAKPFESQDLIGKIKKALGAAPARPAPAAAPPPPAAKPAAPPQQQPAAAKPASPQPKPKAAVPSDIFDIIQEAPSQAEMKRVPAPAAKRAAPADESVFEVEPEVEVEQEMRARPARPAAPPAGPQLRPYQPQQAPAAAPAFAPEVEELVLPRGAKAVDEIRTGLGLKPAPAPQPEIVNFETLDRAVKAGGDEFSYAPPPRAPQAAPVVSDEAVRLAAEQAVARVAREVLEKVAWEVIPDLAERLIKEEIERLKAET